MTLLTVKQTCRDCSPASFADWIEGRRTVHLSTNAGADEVAFQGWRKFKEAFAPELVAQAFEETSNAIGREVKSCIDPFGGSGTTALACQFLGVHPTTVEVNPYLADLIEAKLSTYKWESLIRDFKSVMTARQLRIHDPFPNAPKTFISPGAGGRYLFSKRVAQRLASLRTRILKLGNKKNRRLLRVLLGAVALPVSNVVVSGKGRRYRKNWQKRKIDVKQVDELFSGAVLKAIYEIRRFQDRKGKSFTLLRGDARAVSMGRMKFDLAIFSPPYPNSFDYTDVYNVELWVCGYLHTAKDNRRLRQQTLSSHVQVARRFGKLSKPSVSLTRSLGKLMEVKSQLWNKNIPSMIEGYFADMEIILKKLKAILRPSGRVYMVVGDSQYAGVQIPVAKILTEVAAKYGYELAGDEPFRSMRVSPQQGGRVELAETLVTLALPKHNPLQTEIRRCSEKETNAKVRRQPLERPKLHA